MEFDDDLDADLNILFIVNLAHCNTYLNATFKSNP